MYQAMNEHILSAHRNEHDGTCSKQAQAYKADFECNMLQKEQAPAVDTRYV